MKNFIFIFALSVIAIILAFLFIPGNNGPDPRYVSENTYQKIILEMSKSYEERPVIFRGNEKSFDLFLTHFFLGSQDMFTSEDCITNIESSFVEFDLRYFKKDAEKKIKSYCTYSTQQLISEGDKYLKKSKGFDYNTLNAMYFYKNAYINTISEYLDQNDQYIPFVIEQSREGFKKFRKIRNQLPDGYTDVPNYTQFGQFDAEDSQ